jgi:hypothetical protein
LPGGRGGVGALNLLEPADAIDHAQKDKARVHDRIGSAAELEQACHLGAGRSGFGSWCKGSALC